MISPIGQFPAECRMEAGSLQMTVQVRASVGPNAYGGCCVENKKAVPLVGPKTAGAELTIDRAEDDVHVKVEETQNNVQGIIHMGALKSGKASMKSDQLSMEEVKRFCVVIKGTGEPKHDTELTVHSVTLKDVAPVE